MALGHTSSLSCGNSAFGDTPSPSSDFVSSGWAWSDFLDRNSGDSWSSGECNQYKVKSTGQTQRLMQDTDIHSPFKLVNWIYVPSFATIFVSSSMAIPSPDSCFSSSSNCRISIETLASIKTGTLIWDSKVRSHKKKEDSFFGWNIPRSTQAWKWNGFHLRK